MNIVTHITTNFVRMGSIVRRFGRCVLCIVCECCCYVCGVMLRDEYCHAYHNKFCPDRFDCEEIREVCVCVLYCGSELMRNGIV